jgi:hypothetical protein
LTFSFLHRLKDIFPRSFLAEFMATFGEKNTQLLLDVFSGTTLEVPSRRTLDNAQRDIIIYETLYTSPNARKTKHILALKYNISPERIWKIFRSMRKQIGENKRFRMADERTGKLKKSKIQIEHQNRRKL